MNIKLRDHINPAWLKRQLKENDEMFDAGLRSRDEHRERQGALMRMAYGI